MAKGMAGWLTVAGSRNTAAQGRTTMPHFEESMTIQHQREEVCASISKADDQVQGQPGAIDAAVAARPPTSFSNVSDPMVIVTRSPIASVK